MNDPSRDQDLRLQGAAPSLTLIRFYGCKTQPPVDPATGAMPEPSVMITWPSMKDPEWKAG